MNKYVVYRNFKSLWIHCLLIFVALTCLFPLFWMLRSSLMTQETIFTDQSFIPSSIHFGNYVKAWTEGHFGRYLLNSILYTTVVVTGIVIISSWAAYAFSRLKFPGRNFFFIIFILAMMIPLPGSFVPLTVLMTKIGFINAPQPWVRQLGYVLCMINVGLALSIILLKTFFDQIPSDLEDAARIDGCNKMGLWRHVALPLARPAIAVIIIFNALNVWNEYILATLLLNDIPGESTIMPLQRGVMVFANAHNVEYPLLMAGLTIAALPIIIIYLIMQKYIIKDLTMGNIKGAFVKKISFFVFLFLSACLSVQAQEAAVDSAVAPVEEIQVSSEIVIPEGVKPSSEYVREMWELNGQGKLAELDILVEEVLEIYALKAKELQSPLLKFPSTAHQDDYAILNDVGTILFIQAEALMNYGKTDQAIAAFQSLIEEYPWAKSWDPRGWYWSVKEKSQASIDVMTGVVEEDENPHLPDRIKTRPNLAFPGEDRIVDYRKYGEFLNVGTSNYRYKVKDQKALVAAIGEGIYPNTSTIYKDPNYRKAKADGRLDGSHWDFVHTGDLEAAFYKWVLAPEPWGVRLFYIGMIFEKAEMYHEALKAYHAIVVNFPKSVAWTSWDTPWYPAQAAIGKIKHIVRFNPELKLDVKWMRIQIKNGYDNDVGNDDIITYPGVIAKRTFWDDLKDKISFLKKKVELGDPVKVVGSGKVQLKQYENGHWQMFVDGEPYIIRGVTYAATKIGQSPDKGTLVSWMYEDSNKNGKADGPYDAWVDKNWNNKKDDDENIVGDFQLLKEMGANTIREYHQPFQPNKEVLRDMYEKYGIRLILGDFLGKYTLGSGASWFEGTNYENPEHQKNMMASVRRMVEEFKDEPYILMWLLGNENNYGVASNANQKPEAYFKFANKVAKMIKEIDPNHPVALCNGDTLYLDLFGKYAPDIDIFAANVYRGDYGFGAFWEQVRDAADKPTFITEYGSPAYAKHLTLKESEHLQAIYHRGNWLDIESNIAGSLDSPGNSIGGVAFQWMDEWWKNYEPFYHDKQSDAIGPFFGGYYYEEWFGLIGQGNGQHSPFLRQLRKVYFAYQEMWTNEDD